MKLLLVDDEPRLVAALARGLQADGYDITVATDGAAALIACNEAAFDAIVLDIMLPRISGYEVLKQLRAREDRTPVLVLSAKDGEHDLADALDFGADDYLVKPFSYLVLRARLRALQRRTASPAAPLSYGALSVDPARQAVQLFGVEVPLAPRELQLLQYLLVRQGAVVSKIELLEQVFKADPDAHPNIVEVYVGYLRRKLDRRLITTVKGHGYRLEAL